VSSVDVYQGPDGRWRWEYQDDEVDLKSNRTYGDADSAMRAARTAYPDQLRQSGARSDRSGGLLHKLSLLLTIALAVIVWRRRQR
jgi:hypothetical protein